MLTGFRSFYGFYGSGGFKMFRVLSVCSRCLKIRRSTVFRVCGVSGNLLWDVGAWVLGLGFSGENLGGV